MNTSLPLNSRWLKIERIMGLHPNISEVELGRMRSVFFIGAAAVVDIIIKSEDVTVADEIMKEIANFSKETKERGEAARERMIEALRQEGIL